MHVQLEGLRFSAKGAAFIKSLGCFVVRSNSWGDAPGWNESALTALRRGNRTVFHFGDTVTTEVSAWLISGQYDL